MNSISTKTRFCVSSFIFIVLLILVLAVSPKVHACVCSYSWCYADGGVCPYTNSPNHWYGEEFSGGSCSTCAYYFGGADNNTTIMIDCSTCPFTTFGTSSNFYSQCVANCGSTGGGGGGGGGAEAAYVVGRMYEDKDGSNSISDPSEIWGPSNVSSCAANVFDSFRMFWSVTDGSALVDNTNWKCDHVGYFPWPVPWFIWPNGPGWGAYFISPDRSHIQEGSSSLVSFRGLPSGYEWAGWKYTICRHFDGNGVCDDTDVYEENFPSSTHVTGDLNVNLPQPVDGGLAMRDHNYVLLKIRPQILSVPPTATCSTSPTVYRYGRCH
jgi:hypothetical protein